MSKQSEAKLRQVYTDKAAVCGNCENFRSTVTEVAGHFGGTYRSEKNLRCGIGGFAVKKMGSCDQHEPKKEGGAA